MPEDKRILVIRRSHVRSHFRGCLVCVYSFWNGGHADVRVEEGADHGVACCDACLPVALCCPRVATLHDPHGAEMGLFSLQIQGLRFALLLPCLKDRTLSSLGGDGMV